LLSVVDFLTLGDHAFDQEGAVEYLDGAPRVVRPANLDDGLPGRGWGLFEASGVRVGVANVQGRVFMGAPFSPFEAAEQAVEKLEGAGAEVILVDFHAEATSEKQAMGWHLAGKVAAVVGTHTHVPTADLKILPGGTAYVTDVGMTGAEGVIGFDRQGWLDLFLRDQPLRAKPAAGPVRLDGVLVESEGRRALQTQRIFR
jgi:metallophosphoesterase (TIGR00282 family)